MALLGINLTLLVGPKVALPAPSLLTENLESAEVTTSDEGRSGFQITFRAGRSGPLSAVDDPLLRLPLLKPFNRLILLVIFGFRPRVLIDGLITNQQFAPSNEPGGSRLTVTGEDVSLAMDLEERAVEHPAQPDPAIALKLIARYARYGLVPVVVPPKVIDPPLPIERIPVQQGTDHAFLSQLAARHGHVFYVEPGPAPFVNRAYWGPPRRLGVPQKALSMGFGVDTNLESIDFQHDGLKPEFVDGDVQDTRTNRKVPVKTFAPARVPLASRPTWLTDRSMVRKHRFDQAGFSGIRAFGHAQGMTDRSNDQVVTAKGEVDGLRYGDVLRARGLVGLRGVGASYDGLYYVKSVEHKLREGAYSQSFTLTREGPGTTTPVVRP
ncbi:MAG: hypothetical protein HC897_12780 [Thermoanaerobaculia bacterium]|nr:hypothetical protein [Thermoanaerobaculia bacterium]